LDFAAFRSKLSDCDFRSPKAMDDLLCWTIAQLEHGIVHVTHPRYFGLFNPMPTFPSECADRIVAALNPQLATSTTSPVPVEIEAHVIRAVGQRAGFSAGVFGHFTTGGAEANFTSLLCALTRSEPKFATAGARAFPGAPVFYVSKDSHLAWLKIAHQAGIGRSAARLVDTDGTGRMDAHALQVAISHDKSKGYVPVMIAATAGTTNAGMIDPLNACAEVARSAELWYHVDAAWGGALIASERLRHQLSGLERADSVTIDAHKWFATTMGCGMFITPHGSVLSSAFHVSAEFMPSNLGGLDPYVTSIQWSRRFLGLRLFLSLAAVGWSGYANHVERAIGLSELLQHRLTTKGWSIANESTLAVTCAIPPSGSPPPRALVDRLLETGRAWISVATFEGRDIVRICITHGMTSSADVMQLADDLEAAF
jgi:aromatic-L-amino-acid decarboxylase